MMKRRYQIIRTAGQPDWAAAPRAQIDQLLWTPQIRITAYAQLVCGDDRLFVHLHADEDAIRAASERLKAYPGFHPIHGNFHDAKALLTAAGAPPLTGVLLDLGVSSHQLDEGDRGFSYHEDAPLDMRMDQSTGLTAAEYLAQVTPEEFRRILTDYGEEKWAARIAQIFAEKRAQKPIQTTADLVAVVDAAIPKAVRRKDDGHPARRTFQAVRIAVNDELAPLENALRDFVELLAPGGRLLVITFHSLEDRMVKQRFASFCEGCICPPDFPQCVCGRTPAARLILRKPVAASEKELEENPRSRSARLRCVERLHEPNPPKDT